MLIAFIKYCQKEKLFKQDEKILLAVSGGVDSVVMCELFYLAGYKFGIAHCNFKLRGKESDEDEKFVRNLADKYNAKFYLKTFETKKYAVSNGISIQMAARELRYIWFEELLKSENYKYVAAAHHSDDQIETFFINMLRGTGISGLHGIQPKFGKLIHPMLFTYRKDIEEFAKKNNISSRSDSSNLKTDYTRNKIRHKLIPVIKSINENYQNTFTNNINRIKQIEKIYNQQVHFISNKLLSEEKNQIKISLNELLKLEPAETYLFEILKDYGFNFSQVSGIIKSIHSITGKKFLSKTHWLIIDREYMIIESKPGTINRSEEYIIESEISVIDEPVRLKISKNKLSQDYTIPKNKKTASFDAEILQFPIVIRRWKKGDYFYPFGMENKKLVSDFFINNKFSISDKENTWIMTSGAKIVWIIGHRIDNRFRISETSTQIVQIEIQY